MFNAIAVGIILLDGWGMIGIWTQNFGFHNPWEVWVCSHSILSSITPTDVRYRSTKRFTDFLSAHGTATLKS